MNASLLSTIGFPQWSIQLGKLLKGVILNDINRNAIIDVILRFARSLDIQDWEMCRTCFMDELETDYSDLRGDPPSMVGADEFVAKRKSGLAGLKTLHISTNHLVEIEGYKAVCTSNSVIYRFDPNLSGDNSFHTYCIYTHRLCKTNEGWKIYAVKQTVIANVGNPNVHGALRK
jgi:hypothetical protein